MHVKALQEMRRVMLESENWENLKDWIEAVTAGGMALQRLNDIDFPEKKGKWIPKDFFHNDFYCSECKHEIEVSDEVELPGECPECHASMKKGENK